MEMDSEKSPPHSSSSSTTPIESVKLLQETREADAATPQGQTRNAEILQINITDEKPGISNAVLGILEAESNDINLNNNNIPLENIKRKLGFHEEEYSSKIEDGKRIIHSLKAHFSTKSTDDQGMLNNEFEKILKSDEDSIMCLYYFKESILKVLKSDYNYTEEPLLHNFLYENIKRLKRELKEKEETLSSEIKKRDVLIMQKREIIKKKNSVIMQKRGIIKKKNLLIKQKNKLLEEKNHFIEIKNKLVQEAETLVTEKNAYAEEQRKKLENLEHQNRLLGMHKRRLMGKWEDYDNMILQLKAEVKANKDELITQQSNYSKLSNDKSFAEQLFKKEFTKVSQNLETEVGRLNASIKRLKDEIKYINEVSLLTPDGGEVVDVNEIPAKSNIAQSSSSSHVFSREPNTYIFKKHKLKAGPESGAGPTQLVEMVPSYIRKTFPMPGTPKVLKRKWNTASTGSNFHQGDHSN